MPRTLKSVGEALDDYDDAYLDCRDLGHQWYVQGYYQNGGDILRRLQCDRCPTWSEDNWRRNGERRGRRYHYPNDYQFHGIPVTRIDIRREVIARVDIFPNHDALLKAIGV